MHPGVQGGTGSQAEAALPCEPSSVPGSPAVLVGSGFAVPEEERRAEVPSAR